MKWSELRSTLLHFFCLMYIGLILTIQLVQHYVKDIIFLFRVQDLLCL